MSINGGGCLCGTLRYETNTEPLRVTFCHCRFCQRATGSAYLVEAIFARSAYQIVAGAPSTYRHRSEGSRKLVTVHFCATCGTKVAFTFERFPDIAGVFAGTFDDPNWFERSPGTSKHIFLDAAQKGTVIPQGYPTFGQHAMKPDGSVSEPEVFDHPHVIGG